MKLHPLVTLGILSIAPALADEESAKEMEVLISGLPYIGTAPPSATPKFTHAMATALTPSPTHRMQARLDRLVTFSFSSPPYCPCLAEGFCGSC